MSTGLRKRIRTHIQPFQRQTTYPTGWGDPMTFDEIAATGLAFRP